MRAHLPLAPLLVLALLLPAWLQASEPVAMHVPLAPESLPPESLSPRQLDQTYVAPGARAPAGIAPPQTALQIEQLREQLLDLEPDRQNRQLIEQVRMAEGQLPGLPPGGVDVTEEEWIEVDETELYWGGRIQGDLITWANDRELGGQPNYFEFRRIRLFAAGKGYGIFDYMLELEFANDTLVDAEDFDDRFQIGSGGVELKDAYLNAVDVPWLGNIRIGHFMAPVGLEQLTSSKNITFLERSLSERFVPGRELGVAAFNHSASQNTTWAAGMFFDDLSDAAYAIEDDNQGFRLVGRMTHTPLYDELSDGRYLVHTGLGYSFTQPRRRDDPNLPGVPFYPIDFDARPEIHRGDDLVDTGDLNAQRYHVLDAEAALVWGPLSVQSELVWTHISEYQRGPIDLYGAYLFASYFLTGENRNYSRLEGSFNRVTPSENFWIVDTVAGPQAGWGAWEVAARWSYLDFSDLAGQQLNDLTVGCNWYWNPSTRFMFNWIHPFAHNSPAGIVPNAQADLLAMRLEVNF